MRQIASEIETDPAIVLSAPHETVVQKLDEVTAARKPVLRWREQHK
jgi:glycine dehydrogenase subunit 2